MLSCISSSHFQAPHAAFRQKHTTRPSVLRTGVRAKSEQPMQILELARGVDLHQHLGVIAEICQRESSKCNRRVLASEQRLLQVWVCSEGRGLSSLCLGVQPGEQEQQRVRMGSIRVQQMHSSSSSSTDSHHCSGQPTESGKENEVILTPLLLFFGQSSFQLTRCLQKTCG